MPPKSLTLTLLIFLQHMRKTYESKVFAISLIQILACFIQSSDVFVFKNSGNLFVVASLYPSPSSRFSWFVLFFEIHRQTWHNQKINEHRTLFSCVWIYPVWMNEEIHEILLLNYISLCSECGGGVREKHKNRYCLRSTYTQTPNESSWILL